MRITDKLIASRIQIVCRLLSVVLFAFVFMLFICGAFANDFDFFDKTFRWLDNVLIVAAVSLVLFIIVFAVFSFKQKKRYELKTMLQIDSLDGKIANQVSIELWNTSQEALKIEKIGFLSAQWQRKKVHGKFQEELVYFPVEGGLVLDKKLPFVLEAGALEVFTFDVKNAFSAYTIYKFFYDIAPAGRKLKIFDGDASEGCLRIRVKDKRLRLFSKKSKSPYLQVWLMLACFVAVFSALFLLGTLTK